MSASNLPYDAGLPDLAGELFPAVTAGTRPAQPGEHRRPREPHLPAGPLPRSAADAAAMSSVQQTVVLSIRGRHGQHLVGFGCGHGRRRPTRSRSAGSAGTVLPLGIHLAGYSLCLATGRSAVIVRPSLPRTAR